jgi:3,4-dihydroxy 2-butanone 4-phosphate synthase/GTP cyclohydrolase II
MSYASIPDVIEAFGRGDLVVVVDDEDRENEGDLIMAAESVTEEQIGFMVRYTSGVICVPMLGNRLDELQLPLMVTDNAESFRTGFTVSVDLDEGVTTGISASDRTKTIRALASEDTRARQLNRPGHIFPLRYKEGGVLRRPGHTEAAVDLARLAGMQPAGVLCELVNDDGTMTRGTELEAFADTHGLLLCTIADLVEYRRAQERLVVRSAEARIPTEHGEFRAVGYESVVDARDHIALVYGNVSGAQDVLVRVHSECLTGDAFGSLRCDCGSQLDEAMRLIADAGVGVVLYIRGHEGRGIGLMHKLKAYALQDLGRDTVQANLDLGLPRDARDYGVGAQILSDLGITTMRLMTNNPGKYAAIEGYGLKIVERVSLKVGENDHNREYLRTKIEKMGHIMDLDDGDN